MKRQHADESSKEPQNPLNRYETYRNMNDESPFELPFAKDLKEHIGSIISRDEMIERQSRLQTLFNLVSVERY